MFANIKQIFSPKNKDLRKRILFTLFVLIIFKAGTAITVPGTQSLTKDLGFLDLWNAMSGGALESFSIFALGVGPYINASIITQLLQMDIIPYFSDLKNQGAVGRRKINQITRYLGIALAFIQGYIFSFAFVADGTPVEYMSFAIILTAGTALLLWIGDQITAKGIGNGISIVLTINIISRIPSDLTKLYEQFMSGKTIPKAILAGIIIAAIIVALVVFVVILQSAERRIPVQYSNKIQGRRQVGGNSSVIPMKVNTAGVIPVIFAQSLLQTPIMLVQLFDKDGVSGFWGKVLNTMNQSNWFNPGNWVYSIGAIVYILLIIGFAYFYTEITFNPLEIAENLKRSGGFIPGIRPGKPTSDYLTSILKNVIFIGAIGLAVVALLPIVFNGLLGASVSFGGTSIIIIVGVIVETLKQVESQMMVRNYKGFLND